MPALLPDLPKVSIFPTRNLMGQSAARIVHDELKRTVAKKGSARIVMACAPSQNDFYAALIPLAQSQPKVWQRVTVFHMDEYVGLSADLPQSFRYYLRRQFLDHVRVAQFHPIRGEAQDTEAVALAYATLLSAEPIDVISLGIGENGHIAFNDPSVADFRDKVMVKEVELDPTCRQQQVNDGCFPTLGDVPLCALTLTLPVFADAGLLACVVPTSRKAKAVRNALMGPISPLCPATLLRQHPNSHLFLDADAASLLDLG